MPPTIASSVLTSILQTQSSLDLALRTSVSSGNIFLSSNSFEESFGAKVIPELKANMNLVSLDVSIAAQAVFSNRA
jgi:hypothetical protein